MYSQFLETLKNVTFKDIDRKGENADNQYFLLFLHCFLLFFHNKIPSFEMHLIGICKSLKFGLVHRFLCLCIDRSEHNYNSFCPVCLSVCLCLSAKRFLHWPELLNGE